MAVVGRGLNPYLPQDILGPSRGCPGLQSHALEGCLEPGGQRLDQEGEAASVTNSSLFEDGGEERVVRKSGGGGGFGHEESLATQSLRRFAALNCGPKPRARAQCARL